MNCCKMAHLILGHLFATLGLWHSVPQAGKPADGKQLGCGTLSRASLCPSHLEEFWKTLLQVLSLLFLCEEGKGAVWKRG